MQSIGIGIGIGGLECKNFAECNQPTQPNDGMNLAKGRRSEQSSSRLDDVHGGLHEYNTCFLFFRAFLSFFLHRINNYIIAVFVSQRHGWVDVLIRETCCLHKTKLGSTNSPCHVCLQCARGVLCQPFDRACAQLEVFVGCIGHGPIAPIYHSFTINPGSVLLVQYRLANVSQITIVGELGLDST